MAKLSKDSSVSSLIDKDFFTTEETESHRHGSDLSLQTGAKHRLQPESKTLFWRSVMRSRCQKRLPGGAQSLRMRGILESSRSQPCADASNHVATRRRPPPRWQSFSFSELRLSLSHSDRPAARPDTLIRFAPRRRNCWPSSSRCQKARISTATCRERSTPNLTYNGLPKVVIV